MAWPPGKHFETILKLAAAELTEVRVIRHDISSARAILDIEARWGIYRIVISEIHRNNRNVRYAYYVLNQENQIVHAFDNSPDNVAIKQRYQAQWKAHLYAEIPHQHDSSGRLELTPEAMTFEAFVAWLHTHLPSVADAL